MSHVLNFFKKWALPVGVAIVLTLSVGSFAVTAINSASTHQIVQEHNSDLATIKANTQQIKTLQIEHNNELQTIKSDTAAVASYAQGLQNQQTDNHNQTLSEINALCVKVGLPSNCGVSPSP